MSGGGGGGAWDMDYDVSCSRLRFRTQIATPQAGVVQSLREGHVLGVGIVGVDGAPVVAVFRDGSLVGGLAGGLVTKLRECLLGGTFYKATVVTVNGGYVLVDIERI